VVLQGPCRKLRAKPGLAHNLLFMNTFIEVCPRRRVSADAPGRAFGQRGHTLRAIRGMSHESRA